MWQLTWMLGLLPDWFWHFLLFVSVIAIFAGTLLKFIPFVRQYAFPIRIAGIALTLLSVFMQGSMSKEAEYAAKIKDLEEKVAKAETESKVVNEKIVTVYKDRVKVVNQTRDVLVDRIVEVEKIIDAECKVPKEAIDIINEAARPPKGAKK